MNIEVELRTFLSEEKYKELLSFFLESATFIATEKQETHYLNTSEDLRIQKNDFFSKVWLKKGKLHDDHREEIEVHFQKEDFAKIEKIFANIGLTPKIKWFRTRNTFLWQGISIMLDDTKGYGYILEVEKMSTEEKKEQDLSMLKEKLQQLNLPLSTKEEFNERFTYYEQNWESLTK